MTHSNFSGMESQQSLIRLPHFQKTSVLILVILTTTLTANAALSVKLDQPKTTGSKTVVQITLKNTFTEKIEGARATLFLIGEKDKVVGQRTAWVIGGEPNRPPLKPEATTTYNFVVDTDNLSPPPGSSSTASFSKTANSPTRRKTLRSSDPGELNPSLHRNTFASRGHHAQFAHTSESEIQNQSNRPSRPKTQAPAHEIRGGKRRKMSAAGRAAIAAAARARWARHRGGK